MDTRETEGQGPGDEEASLYSQGKGPLGSGWNTRCEWPHLRQEARKERPESVVAGFCTQVLLAAQVEPSLVWGGGVVSTGSLKKQLKNVTLTTKIKKSEKIKQTNQNSLQPLA